MQANDSVMCEYYCIGFIDFMLKGKSYLECTIFLNQMNMKKKLMLGTNYLLITY